MKKLSVLLLSLALVGCAGAKTTTGTSEYAFKDHGGNDQKNMVTVELEDGKITKIEIDETYADKDGNPTTKMTLKEAYGMKGKSPIGKEWFEQIEFLQEKLVGTDGKIELDEAGYATNEDVKAGCTINLGNIQAAIDEAIANAK